MRGWPASRGNPVSSAGGRPDDRSGPEVGNADLPAGDPDILGPVDVVVVEFPGGTVGGTGFDRLRALADTGVVRILDLEFVSRLRDGSVVSVDVRDVAVAGGVDLTSFAGSDSSLVDATDLHVLHESISPGSVAAVLVYEEQVLNPVVAAWQSAGARLALVGHLDPADLDEVLDATDDAEEGN